MSPANQKNNQESDEIQQLMTRVRDAEETLRAIQNDEVDALVVSTADGDKVFTLSGAEHPYRVMVESMNEGAITMASDGTILYANQRFAAIVNMTQDQVRGSSFFQYLSANDLHNFWAFTERGRRECGRMELSLKTSESLTVESVPVFLSINAFHHENVPGTMVLVVTDLTEQKRADEILAEERLTNQILDQAEEIFLVCDEKGSIIRASQSTARLFGKSLLFQHFDEAFPLLLPDGTPFVLLSALEDALLHSFEVVFKPEKDKTLYFLMSAKALDTPKGVLGIVVVLVNITDRKREEEILAISEIRYRRLFETARDGIVILDAETGLIQDVNPFLINMSGYPKTYFLGKKLWELGFFEETEALKSDLLALQRSDSDRHNELRLTTKSGLVLTVELISNAYHVDQHHVVQCNIRDISDRKRDSEALQLSHDKLEQRVDERTSELKAALQELKVMKDQLEAENIYFRQEIVSIHHHDTIIGQSKCLNDVLYRAEQVAPTDATVLILGETGTGKELVANAIHNMSPRKNRAMITVNCATLPPTLIESELFGREKGAFTGADARQLGRFEIANGSTLCLDEIGELPMEMQAKLLRVLQNNEFERLGSSRTIKVDVRIIATTNRDLEEEVRKGRFRQDLFYRLNVFPLIVPPLRQRKEDIQPLTQAFIERFSRKMGKKFSSIQKKSIPILQNYSWPGNIRELQSIIERAVILCPGPVLEVAGMLDSVATLAVADGPKTLEEVERNQILKGLAETHWRIEGKNGAAAMLGLHPSTLRARMHKLGIHRPKAMDSE